MASTEQQSLELLEKVLFKLALTDDSQLEAVLTSVLVPIIRELNTTSDKVRNKTLEVLSHINKRIKTQQNIKLPLRDLRDLFVSASLNAFQKNFALIYLEMAFNRAPINDQQETTALLYNQISSLPAAQQDIILNMTTQVLHGFKIPQDKTQRQAAFMFTHSVKDKNIILDYWFDLLLLVLPSTKEVQQNPNFLAPGLSVNAQKRVKGKHVWTYELLAKVKENVVDFLISIGDLFESQEIFIHFAIAAADNINSVSRKGEDGIRKYFVAKDLEDKQVVDKLFKLFLGSQKTDQGAAEDKRTPVSYNIKMKILEYINRSTVATNNFPSSLQLIFESLFGIESTSRMKQSSISFIQWVLRMADDKYIQLMAPLLFSGLLKLLASLKLPEAQEALTSQIRGSTYSAIGALSKKAPQLFSSNVQLLEEFFQDTSTEEPNVRVYIQEALTHMCTAYLPVIESNAEVKQKVEAILLANAEKGDSQSRYLSVYYTNRLFTFDHVPARYINLLLSNDQRSDVREESHRGLKPYKRNDRDVIADETQKWSDFENLCSYVHEKAAERRKPDQLPFGESTYKDVLEYLYSCLEHAIDGQMTPTERTEDAKRKFKLLREYVEQVTSKDNNAINKFCQLIAEVLGPIPSSELLRVGAEAALKIAAISPAAVASVVPNASGVERGNREAQKSLAQLLSITIAWYYSAEARTTIFNELLAKVKSRDGVKKDEVLGSMWALSFGISRCNQRDIVLPQELLTAVMDELWTSVQSSIVTVQLTACQCIGIIGRFKPLPVEASKKTQIIARLIEILNSTEGLQIETAAEALGNIGLGDRSSDVVKQVLDALLNLFKVKQEEVYFSVGEAITLAAVAWQSTAAADPLASLDDREQRKSPQFDEEPMATVVSTILDKYLFSDRSDTRTAACIWLLSIVKQCGAHPAVTSRLGKIQAAFGRLLADNNEVVQEVASRGLVLLFELGDQSMQQALVNDLVSTLSGGQQGFKVDQGSQIWGVTQEGSSGLTTYKELAALATDMNQPDLVYKFLNLASHHALWNSKKGAAFAAKTLATKAESQLKPYLPKLIPKLYRSQYDPNQKIANAMSNILNALVDSKKVGALYFDDLMKDLLDNMFSSQWRTREATCYALADLLVGRTADQVLTYLEPLWAKVTLVIDDIKETVRKAAEQAFKTLSSITVRLCDPQHTPVKQAQQAVDMALPFLLKKGVNSSIAEVRTLSMKQIASICKTASFLIKPHLEDLVGIMLESIAFNEPQEINYIEQHAANLGLSRDVLDEVRRSQAKGGPAELVLTAALDSLDAQTGPTVLNRAIITCRTALSASAKAFSAQFIQKAAVQRPEAVKPALPRLMKDLIGLLPAKSSLVRKEVALAIGSVGKLSSEKSLQASIEDLVDRYQKADAEDMPVRLGVAEAILSLLKNCGYAMQPFYKTIIPIVFFARQDPNEETQKIFTEIWQEAGASLSLYIDPVVELITTALDSSSWMIKKQGAMSISKFAGGINFSQMDAKQFKALLASLLTSMRGRLWQGKEALLDALQSFVSNYKKNIFDLAHEDKTAPTPAQIVQVCVTECKKRNREYKKEALNCLASVLNSFDQVAQLYNEHSFDAFESLKDLLTQIASGAAEQDEDEEEKKSADKNQLELECRGKAFRCLALAYNRSDDTSVINQIVDFFVAQNQIQEWTVKAEILVAFKILFNKLNGKSEVVTAQVFTVARRQSCINEVFVSFDAKNEAIRQSALDAVSAMLSLKTAAGSLVFAAELPDITSRLQVVASKNSSLATAVDKLLLPFKK